MSFSDRVIGTPPPPSTRAIRVITGALWAMPVLISVGCLAAIPSKTGDRIAGLFNGLQAPQEFRITLASATIKEEPALRPASFQTVATTPRYQSVFDMPLRNQQRFPMKLAFTDTTVAAERVPAARQRIAGKSALKARVLTILADKTGISNETVASISPSALELASAPLVNTRIFSTARVEAANMLSAGGMTIVLTDINPPRPGSKCRRLDGVLLNCTERAEARLAVLLMHRRLTCKVSAPVQNNVVAGKCRAGKIDIARDLLRHGLANRATASASKTVL